MLWAKVPMSVTAVAQQDRRCEIQARYFCRKGREGPGKLQLCRSKPLSSHSGYIWILLSPEQRAHPLMLHQRALDN